MRCDFPTGTGRCANPPGTHGRCAAGHPSRSSLTAALASHRANTDSTSLAASVAATDPMADPHAPKPALPHVANTPDARQKGTWWRDEDLVDAPEGLRASFRHLQDGKYRLYDTGSGAITVQQRLANGTHRHVGYLSWFGGTPALDGNDQPIDDHSNINAGMIHKVVVSRPARRNGLATAMLDFARERHPASHIRHSGALSDNGKAWAAATP